MSLEIKIGATSVTDYAFHVNVFPKYSIPKDRILELPMSREAVAPWHLPPCVLCRMDMSPKIMNLSKLENRRNICLYDQNEQILKQQS